MWPNSNYGFNNGGSQGNQNSPNGFNQGGPEQQYPPFFPPFYPHQFHPGGNGQLELHLSGPYGLYNNQVFLRNQMGAPQVSQVNRTSVQVIPSQIPFSFSSCPFTVANKSPCAIEHFCRVQYAPGLPSASSTNSIRDER